MSVHHAALFIALFVLIHFYLSIKIIGRRRSKQIAYGDGGDDKMIRLKSAQANLFENATYMSLLLITSELMLGAAGKRFGLILFVLASLFLIGRLLHVHGMIKFNLKTRKLGMHLTLWPLLATTAYAIFLSFAPLFS